MLQGSSFCNIDCRYCYVMGRNDKLRMSHDVLEAVVDNIVTRPTCPDVLNIAWHAGEPLALPPRWMDEACQLISDRKRTDQTLRFGVQTNATLISPRWLEVIEKHAITVGVSVDGPRDIHDAYRRTRSGEGTFDATFAGIAALRDAGIAFDIIAVLTRPALAQPERMFAAFAALEPRSVGFNVEEIEGPHRHSSLEEKGSTDLYRSFLERFLALHEAAGRPFRLRALDVGGASSAAGANDQRQPLSILTVGVDGSLSTFSPELIGVSAPRYADLVFGNVLDGPPERILQNAAFQHAMRSIAAGIGRCRRRCEYYNLCGGGAPGNKFFEHGDFDAAETLYCKFAVRATVDAVLTHRERAQERSHGLVQSEM